MNKFKKILSDTVSSKKFMLAATFAGFYLISTGTSWAVFSYLRSEPSLSIAQDLEGSRSKIYELPRTEECPINGGLFTEVERDIWQDRRPIAAIIENHVESRPPSGISKADVVYEAVAEGGITRLLAIFYCGASASDIEIAPVRSARVYYVSWAAEYGDKPIFMHVGGANDFAGFGDTAPAARALELLADLDWRLAKGNDFDTTYDSGFPVFWRNYDRLEQPVATEHTMMASLDAAYKEAEKRGFVAKAEGISWDESFVKWRFSDDKPAVPIASDISFKFWRNKEDYDVTWKYDGQSNQYLRFNDGSEYIDLTTKAQVSAKNVVIQFVRERGPVDRNLHLLYTTIGSGRALIFQNGGVIEATWEKDSRLERTKFFDEEGNEVAFVRGPIWVEAVPAGNKVEY